MTINTKSVRYRTTAVAGLTLSCLLLLGGLIIFFLVRAEIRDAFDQSLLDQASDRAVSLDAGTPPEALTTTVGSEELVVIIDNRGEIVAARGAAEPNQLLTIPLGLSSADLTLIEHEGEDAEIEQEPLRLAVVETASGSRVILGGEGEGVRKTIRNIGLVLAIVTSLSALGAAAAAWFLTGRALAPVEQMRDDLDGIVHASSGMRVSSPGSGDEIDELATTMNEVLDRLDEQSVVRRTFVSDASHELKSPLANARVQIETTPLDLSEAEEQQLRNSVVVELDRMQTLVDDMLYLAQNDETRTTVKERVELDDVVFDEAERAAVRTAKRIDASGVQPFAVAADPNEIARAVRNLIENATRHATSVVRLTMEASDSMVSLIIDDDGPGIPADQREHVFERFTRLSEHRSRRDGGTGLGLAIVASIADKNGGLVAVDESPSGGARLVISLPLANDVTD